MVIDVYQQYFKAKAKFNGVQRKAASVKLTSDSEAGFIKYTVSVNFFPYRDPEDFAVSYDACFSRELYYAPGRRSKKREEKLMEGFRAEADALAAEAGGVIDWDSPLREARFG